MTAETKIVTHFSEDNTLDEVIRELTRVASRGADIAQGKVSLRRDTVNGGFVVAVAIKEP